MKNDLTSNLISKPLEIPTRFFPNKKISITTRKNNIKSAKLRRQRGYHWEDTLVKRFNSTNGWKAFRLGSPSIALPDILVVSDRFNSIFAIEAKSGTSTSLQVPFDQILRCLNWTKTFGLYKQRKVILAFKFLSKKRIDIGKYEKRELKEHYKIWDESQEVVNCVCTYNGETYGIKNKKHKKLVLDEFTPPFIIKKRGRPKK